MPLNNFIQVTVPKKKSEEEILESLNRAQQIRKDAIIDKLSKSIDILDKEIKLQAIKYVRQRDSQKKGSKGGLNRRKRSLKKFHKV